MPISTFYGQTFVAFLDISGFKKLMENGRRAWKALDTLYRYGWRVLQENEREVEGLFISDSGILFVRNCQDEKTSLKSLLAVLKEVNEKMLQEDFILTTSIAYGEFRYQRRIEFEGIEKAPIYGNAYVSAFLDNENGKPKIQPGQCRIVKENLPIEIEDVLEGDGSQDEILHLVKKRNDDRNHYYFYWMVEEPWEIDRFERHYTDAYNLKYAGMLKALKGEENEYNVR